ncbi:MAG TPA: hypothetical protein VJI98_03910 [Candidatus Nanoarchaeia archaeon]|nr:hypothetical protein [Candidatus Nanoarchaeia archaeon]
MVSKKAKKFLKSSMKKVRRNHLSRIIISGIVGILLVTIIFIAAFWKEEGNVAGQAGCQFIRGRVVCGGSYSATAAPSTANCVDTDQTNDPNAPGHLVVRNQITNRDACVSGLFLDQWKCGAAPLNQPEAVSRVNCPNGCSVDSSGDARCNAPSSVCGNGIVETGEQCDNGAACNDGFQCNPTVGFNICGTRTGGGSCQARGFDGCNERCLQESIQDYELMLKLSNADTELLELIINGVSISQAPAYYNRYEYYIFGSNFGNPNLGRHRIILHPSTVPFSYPYFTIFSSITCGSNARYGDIFSNDGTYGEEAKFFVRVNNDRNKQVLGPGRLVYSEDGILRIQGEILDYTGTDITYRVRLTCR